MSGVQKQLNPIQLTIVSDQARYQIPPERCTNIDVYRFHNNEMHGTQKLLRSKYSTDKVVLQYD